MNKFINKTVLFIITKHIINCVYNFQKRPSEEKKYRTHYKIVSKNANEIMPVRRGKICISKVKHPSKHKQAILWEREVNRQRKNRNLGHHLDTIILNFNNMKIIADPIIDVDIVREISVLNIFGSDYRQTDNVKIGDDILESHRDISKNIQNLLLGPTPKVVQIDVKRNLSDNIMNQTLSLSLS